MDGSVPLNWLSNSSNKTLSHEAKLYVRVWYLDVTKIFHCLALPYNSANAYRRKKRKKKRPGSFHQFLFPSMK